MDRHGAVSGDRQDHEQLLEVRPVIFVVAVSDCHGRLAPHLATVRAAIRPGEGQGGRIVVELIERDPELPHRCQHQLRQHRRAVGVKQPVERPADPVIVEQRRFAVLQSEQVGLRALRPFDHAIDGRPAVQNNAAEQHAEGLRGVELAASRGEDALQEGRHAQALQEVVHQRQAADKPGNQTQLRWRLTRGHSYSLLTASLSKVKDNLSGPADTDPRFESLKRDLLRLGYVRPGSVVRRFMTCGNPSCRCMAQPPQLHGPYFQWTYKVHGKTKTVRLSQEQARLCEAWSQNHRQLRGLVRKLEQLSLKKTDRFLGAISRS